MENEDGYRAREINNVYASSGRIVGLKKYVLQHICNTMLYGEYSKKYRKKCRIYLEVVNKSSTFAPAFENESSETMTF